jgi:hypothetical protein
VRTTFEDDRIKRRAYGYAFRLSAKCDPVAG